MVSYHCEVKKKPQKKNRKKNFKIEEKITNEKSRQHIVVIL